jgi:hypothetical protein
VSNAYARLGVELSADQAQQLLACIRELVSVRKRAPSDAELIRMYFEALPHAHDLAA